VGLDGFYGLTPRQMVDTGAIERVDIFKGASAFVNGAAPGGSGVGGTINVQTKVADDKPVTRVTVEGSASGELGTHVDVGRRFGDNDQFGIRVNQTVVGGSTAVQNQDSHSQQTAISLDYRGDKLRLYADFLYQKNNITGGRPGVFVTGDDMPSTPSASYNYAQPWTYSKQEDTVGMLRGEYDIAPNWTAYAGIGSRHTTELGQYETPTYDAGSTTAYRMNTLFKETRSRRRRVCAASSISARFRTRSMRAGRSNASRSTALITGATASVVDEPLQHGDGCDPGHHVWRGRLLRSGLTSTTLMRSFVVSDTLGFFHDRLLFTVGARHQNIVERL
jgi:iron complex outermembrane receptor protein